MTTALNLVQTYLLIIWTSELPSQIRLQCFCNTLVFFFSQYAPRPSLEGLGAFWLKKNTSKDISKDYSASIFRIKRSYSFRLAWPFQKGTTIVWNISTYL
jgi:hypothetical protein